MKEDAIALELVYAGGFLRSGSLRRRRSALTTVK
jgi:hypothetical protein